MSEIFSIFVKLKHLSSIQTFVIYTVKVSTIFMFIFFSLWYPSSINYTIPRQSYFTHIIFLSDYSLQKCPNSTQPTDEIYFPHPDASKFIQCGAGGTGYVLNCPTGTIWRESAKKCVSPYADPDVSPSL